MNAHTHDYGSRRRALLASRTRLAAGVAFTLAMAGGIATASADEADAKRIFQAMSDYLAAQTAISFDYDSTLEVVSSEGQKFSLASSGTVDLARPDKLSATRTGGFADVALVFDGTTLSVLAKNLNAYAEIPAQGNIDQLIDTLRDKYHVPMPAADLLSANVSGEIMPLVTDVKDLGSGVIGGMECDHVAFRTDDVDLQIWVAQGDAPYPCRYEITTRDVAGNPSYTILVSNWKTGAQAGGDFTFAAPEGAKKIDSAELPSLDELPPQFTPGEAK
ncbi:MAG: DUF2092 domain-containing protein [Bauldia sp.]|nr:DUF2092 domain-containing protein [Bauldia sp.]